MAEEEVVTQTEENQILFKINFGTKILTKLILKN